MMKRFVYDWLRVPVHHCGDVEVSILSRNISQSFDEKCWCGSHSEIHLSPAIFLFSVRLQYPTLEI